MDGMLGVREGLGGRVAALRNRLSTTNDNARTTIFSDRN
jgi:hypothetical protein